MTLATQPTPLPPQAQHGDMQSEAAMVVVLGVVSRCIRRGKTPRQMARVLAKEAPAALSLLGVEGEPSRTAVNAYRRRVLAEIREEQMDLGDARALAIVRLNITLAPLMDRIESEAEEGRADLRAIETLRRVVSTQAEIQGLTRAREGLADSLEQALHQFASKQRAMGTIASEAPQPAAMREGVVQYPRTIPHSGVARQVAADRAPGHSAASAVISAGDRGDTLDAVQGAAWATQVSHRARRDRMLGVGAPIHDHKPDD